MNIQLYHLYGCTVEMDVANFFDRSTTERDLNGNSQGEEHLKQPCDESPYVSDFESTSSPGNKLTEILKLEDCTEILLNCSTNK